MTGTPWFEDEPLWEELYPFMFGEERFSLAERQAGQIVELAGLRRGAAVLDLGCGPGRHAIPLARRGFLVTGVDRTPALLGRARDRATAAGVPLELVDQDMRRFVRPAAFDLALNLQTSFGFFEDPADDLAVLRNARTSLVPGGTLVLDMTSKEWLAGHFQATTSTPGPDGTLLVRRHEVVDDWTRVRNEWILVRAGTARSFRFVLRVYSGQELRDLLGRAGFATVRLFGDLDGRPYDREASRLVALARTAD